MSQFTAADAERLQTQTYSALLKQILTEGIQGAESIDASLAASAWPSDDRSLRAAFYAIARVLQSGAGYSPGTWVPMAGSFQGTWLDFGSGYQAGAYRIDSAGIVHLRGLVTTSPGGAAVPSNIFQLPVAPTAQLMFSSITNNGWSRIDISTSGMIILQNNGTPEIPVAFGTPIANGNQTGFTTLSGIYFDPRP